MRTIDGQMFLTPETISLFIKREKVNETSAVPSETLLVYV